MLREKALIVFDLDDTLYKEVDFVFSGREAVANYLSREYDIPLRLLKSLSKKYSPTQHDTFDEMIRICKSRGTNVEISEILEVYREHHPRLKLSKNFSNVLKRLKSENHSLALITDGRSITQRNKIQALGLEEFIPEEAIFISEEIGKDKTHTLPYEILETRYPFVSKRIYIGDNPQKDFIQANKRGWMTVMVEDIERKNIHSQNLEGLPKVYLPHSIIKSPEEIYLIIN